MTMYLGETAEFWIRVRGAMRKARISTWQELEERLQVTPPTYEAVEDEGRWKVLERRPHYGDGLVVGWGATKEEAERIAVALSRRELDFAA